MLRGCLSLSTQGFFGSGQRPFGAGTELSLSKKEYTANF